MRIAIISDSHGRLPAGLEETLAPADRILHLGDIGPGRILERLEALAPVLAVQGNNDPPGRPGLPPERLWRAEGLAFALRHLPWNPASLDGGEGPTLYLHGHTHRPSLREVPRGRILCPGALQMPRGGFPSSLAWVVLEEGRARIRVRSLEDRGVLLSEDWGYLPPGH